MLLVYDDAGLRGVYYDTIINILEGAMRDGIRTKL